MSIILQLSYMRDEYNVRNMYFFSVVMVFNESR